jgi:putative transposase
VNELGQAYGLHPVQISQWKKALLENAGSIFEGKRGPAARTEHEDSERLYSDIGRLTMELDWLKKIWSEPVAVREQWISQEAALSVITQCHLAGVNRATWYAHQRSPAVDLETLTLCRLIDEEYTRHPFFGSRRMVWLLRQRGFLVNRKRGQRLMQHLGRAGRVPGPQQAASGAYSLPLPAAWR